MTEDKRIEHISAGPLVRGPIIRGTYRKLHCELEPLLYEDVFYIVYKIDCWKGYVYFGTYALHTIDAASAWKWVLAELDAALRRAALARFLLEG